MAIESSPKHNGRTASLCKQLIKCKVFYGANYDFQHTFTHSPHKHEVIILSKINWNMWNQMFIYSNIGIYFKSTIWVWIFVWAPHEKGRRRERDAETEEALFVITKLLLKTTTESQLLYCHISADPPVLPVWQTTEGGVNSLIAKLQYQQAMAFGKFCTLLERVLNKPSLLHILMWLPLISSHP